ncbi:formate dehydrogenase subunit gamma [Azospirillum halopraeferens]|uniref:formate dehydrogenase subunit gamma n=1 Tax=Azospirillum halopraeferens TaxID=34010 RepID=UPI0003FF3823|nr:formate dehydrogenase subunit gamma [Azospirillum halopraeferens]
MTPFAPARLLPLVLLLTALLFALPAAAQSGPGAVAPGGGGGAPAQPGLEGQTPSPDVRSPADVPLYIPHDGRVQGRISIPDPALATLIQPGGRDWRGFRMDWLQWIGGVVILGALAALAVFYFWRGPITIERGRARRWVPRFNSIDRFAHWTTALGFIALMLSGLVLTFGRFVLIPIMGHGSFAPLADWSKYLHMASSVPFVLGLLLMLGLWIRDNIPTRADLIWLRQAGGLFSRHSVHPESGRFNAGQKGLFWLVVLGGLAMALTGYLLMTPFYYTGIAGMQIIHIIHALLAMVLTAVIFGHIYIGTVGMEGAFDAMGRGVVDENWAIEHHKGWYDEQCRAGRIIPGDRMPQAGDD